jgi:protein-S-isoprenylcysteine O-methyltransferase Ste14
MLYRLQGIEMEHHRERKVRWGPRTLDLDIIATDGEPRSADHLVIPHPRATEREFVLRPLVDVWPEAPLGDVTAAAALDEIEDQGVHRLARDWVPPVSKWPSHLLMAGQFGLLLAVAIALAQDGSLPDGEIEWSRVVGMVLAFAGLTLAFVATRRLGTAMTANPIPKPDAELVTGGPFSLVRHPIYGGLISFLVGTSLVLDSMFGLLVTALLVALLLVKSSFEERQMRMRHAGYLAYKQRVPRRLIPFLL